MSGFCKIKTDGEIVILDMSNRTMQLNAKAAYELGRALIAKAKLAEEIENAGKIIQDGAILDRAGAPFGISSHPEIKKEIRKEAQHNRELRRSNLKMPTIHSKETFGAPTVRTSQ